jgi:hypothetical protein
MTPKDLKARLEMLATRLGAVRHELQELSPALSRNDDKQALPSMIIDLA